MDENAALLGLIRSCFSYQDGQVIARHPNFRQDLVVFGNFSNVGFFDAFTLTINDIYVRLAVIAPSELSGTIRPPGFVLFR